jgi:hypothetical protein
MKRRVLSGSIVLAFLLATEVVAQRPGASLIGAVTDSVRHSPLGGATVVASRDVAHDGLGLDFTANTDAKGRFAFASLPPDVYTITVEHPWLDSTGLSVPARSVDLRAQSSAAIALAVPSPATIRHVLCPLTAADSTLGFVAGYVQDAVSDRPVAGARVVVLWSDFDVDRHTARTVARDRGIAGISGKDGTFRMCGIPLARSLLMQAQVGERGATGAIEVQVGSSGVLVATLRIADATTARGSTATVTGVVTRSGANAPIRGARVHLFGAPDEVVTEPDGSFHLTGVPLGTQSVEVRAVGFSPARQALDVRGGDLRGVAIHLDEAATVLDSVKVLAKGAGGRSQLYKEFDARASVGQGQYVTEDAIRKAAPFATSDLFRTLHGISVVDGTIYSSRGVTALNAGNQLCSPAVFLDGNQIGGGVDEVRPDQIHGIEVYTTATAPAKYKAAGLCGVILIWSK